MKKAVLLLSSGLDSAANLALADTFEPVAALTIDYGQRGAAQEMSHAAALSKHFGVKHFTFDLSGFSDLIASRSALFGAGKLPSPDSLDDPSITTQTASAVWVPNRNGVMISIAAAFAESRSYDAVAVGFNAEEATTFPDNTVDYMRAMTASLKYSTANGVDVVSATAEMTKADIVRRLAQKKFPFELLWSCYEGKSQHCGNCESCQRLKRALSLGLGEPEKSQVLERLFTAGAAKRGVR